MQAGGNQVHFKHNLGHLLHDPTILSTCTFIKYCRVKSNLDRWILHCQACSPQSKDKTRGVGEIVLKFVGKGMGLKFIDLARKVRFLSSLQEHAQFIVIHCGENVLGLINLAKMLYRINGI